MSTMLMSQTAMELPDDLVGRLVQLLNGAEAMIGRHPDIAADHLRSAHSMLTDRSPTHHGAGRDATSIRGRLALWQEERIKGYIADNLVRRLSSAELAQVVKLSPGYFLLAFKGSFGMSPSHYIAEMRVAQAKALMVETDHGFVEIALMCGLSDQAHLCHLFRRRVGMSPSTWKRLRQLGRLPQTLA